MIKQAETLGMYAVWDEEIKPLFSALTQHRRYLAEVVEDDPDHQHVDLFNQDIAKLDGLIERFCDTMSELGEAGRL